MMLLKYSNTIIVYYNMFISILFFQTVKLPRPKSFGDEMGTVMLYAIAPCLPNTYPTCGCVWRRGPNGILTAHGLHRQFYLYSI